MLQYCLDIECLYVNVLYLMTCFLTVQRGDDGQKTYVHDLVSEHDPSVHEGGCAKYIRTESLRRFQTRAVDALSCLNLGPDWESFAGIAESRRVFGDMDCEQIHQLEPDDIATALDVSVNDPKVSKVLMIRMCLYVISSLTSIAHVQG